MRERDALDLVLFFMADAIDSQSGFACCIISQHIQKNMTKDDLERSVEV